MTNLCIIPARGGSKRILRKNIKSFLGKPIIAYSIELAIKSNLFNEVMVSTDDTEIKEIAIKYGAKVPFMRSAENSNDFATTLDVIEEVTSHYKHLNIHFSNVCCIYPCAPLIQTKILYDCYTLLMEGNSYSTFPIVEYANPIQRAFKLSNGKIEMFDEKYAQARSQDLEKAYFDSGQFYWMNIDRVIEGRSIYTKNSGCVIIDTIYAQDIDNYDDWTIAEMKYEILNNSI